MSDNVAEPTFVAAAPGWDVLTRSLVAGFYESTPVVAWACLRSDEFVRAFPVTAALAWSLNEDRVVCTPDGRVIEGDKEWATIEAWLGDTPRITAGASLTGGAAILALDAFRGKFMRGE